MNSPLDGEDHQFAINEENNLLLELKNASVNLYGKVVLHGLDLRVFTGKHLAIIGESGSGKSTLLKVLADLRPVSSGTMETPLMEKNTYWHNQVVLVETKPQFRNVDGVTPFYYQQRFNAGDAPNILTAGAYLRVIQQKHDVPGEKFSQIMELLQFSTIEEKLLIQLSSGETRRLLLAAALLQEPKLLLFDMPLTGLDVEGREAFESLLQNLTHSGTTVVMTTIAEQVPRSVSTVALLDNGNITRKVSRKEWLPEKFLAPDLFQMDASQLNNLFTCLSGHQFKQLISLKNITVKYGDSIILHQLNWDVKPGEKWAVVGPNGAGKSTLLSLINADHPQAYSNDITLYDRKRGTGESIWDIKKNTGFISAELYQYFPTEQNCLQVIESGYYDTIGLFRRSIPERALHCLEWMKLFDIFYYSNRLFSQVPSGIQRLVLLIRALVKNPALLILDEPTQGLDDHQQAHFKQIISHICSNPDVAVLYVTHQYKELPSCIKMAIRLKKGQTPEKITTADLMV